MRVHKDQKYIDALLQSDEEVIEEIYKYFSQKIITYITQNSGDINDAADIFQESLLDLHRMAHKGFVLTRPFQAYLFGICRNKWMDKLKKRKKRREVLSLEVADFEKERFNSELLNEVQPFIQKSKNYELYIDNFKTLSSSCQEIIGLSTTVNDKKGKENSLKDIAEILELNYSYVRRKKNECLEKLIELIKKDRRY